MATTFDTLKGGVENLLKRYDQLMQVPSCLSPTDYRNSLDRSKLVT